MPVLTSETVPSLPISESTSEAVPSLSVSQLMSETVPSLLILLAVTIIVIGGLIVFSRYQFKGGLGVKIFSLIAPAMGTIGYMGFFVGRLYSLSSFLIAVTIMVAAAVFAMMRLNSLVVKQYQQRIGELMASVAQLSATARETAATAAEQSSAVTQITTTIEELDRMNFGAAETAEKVLGNSSDAVKKGEDGILRVTEAARVVEAVGQVREVVDTVNDLAEQSNLLAVNAGIEAAKAGDYGLGFSVVASEVRNLAEQSKGATAQIRGALNRTEEGGRAIQSVRQVIDDLAKVLRESSDDARQISNITNQQAAGTKQIYSAMANLAEGSKQTAGATEQLNDAVANLTRIGSDFRSFISGEKGDDK